MAYSFVRQITIHSSRVPADLANFPFLFKSTVPDLRTTRNGGHIENTLAVAGALGVRMVPTDLVFSPNRDGSSKYDFEVKSYDPNSGELIARIRIPFLSSTEDTVLFVVYGDPDIDVSQENAAGAWDAHYIPHSHPSTS